MLFNKFAYHAGDFKHKYGTLKQGLSGTSFVSGYFYTTTKEACEYQGAGFNLENKRPVYQFSLDGLNLLPLTAEDCKILNLYNKVCYNYPVYEKYHKKEYYDIKEKLDECFEDFYCDNVADDIKPVKFFRELSDFYNSDKESFPDDEDYDFQTFIYCYASLKKLKESLEDSDQLPYLNQVLNLNEFVFTGNQELVNELDDFLYNVDLAYRLNKMIERVADLLHKSTDFISNEAFEMYEKYEAYYKNDRFDNFSAPNDDLFATQLLKELNYVGTYPIDEIADSTEFGGCIFDIENIKNMRLIKNMRVFGNKNFRENRIYNNEFVSDKIEDFLKDVAQFSGLISYSDIEAFEKDVFYPSDLNVKALRQLYKQAKEADEEELEQIYQEVADIVTGADDRNPESWYNESFNKKIKKHVREDFEFYTKPNGKIYVDKVVTAASKSGKSFNDGTSNGNDTSEAIKRTPLSQMSDEDKELAQAAYSTLKKSGSINNINKKFKTSPKADVVMKADSKHADIYYDNNTSGEPDEKYVQLVDSRKRNIRNRIKEAEAVFVNFNLDYELEYIQDILVSIDTLCPDISLETQELIDDLLKDLKVNKHGISNQYDVISIVDSIDTIADNLLTEGYEDYAKDLWDSIATLRQANL